jgi:tetratricopeptide (TPR) repeat protein
MKTIILAGVFMGCLAAGHAQAQAAAPSDQALFNEGQRAYAGGSYAEAIDLFTQALQVDPGDLNAYLQRGFCHSLSGQYDLAIADFTSVIDRKKDHIWAYISRGSAYKKAGKLDLALKDFDAVLQMDPRNEEAFNNRGWTYKALGNTQAACADWQASKKMGNDEAKVILRNNHCK